MRDTIVKNVAEVATSGRSRIATCAAYGVSCEGWLKVELLQRFTRVLQAVPGADIEPELQNVDLTISTPSQRFLIELKTFPTNYGRSGKPITNFIQGVVSDLGKLRTKKQDSDIGLAVWMAYVVPEPVPSTWSGHFRKVEAHAAQTICSERILLWDNAYANLYVMQSE